jgi:hypothetical protein
LEGCVRLFRLGGGLLHGGVKLFWDGVKRFRDGVELFKGGRELFQPAATYVLNKPGIGVRSQLD